MKGKMADKRMIHYDLLRIVAAFSVVMLHSAAQFWYTLDIYKREWMIANSYDALFRFGVPVFVMISGALFLRPDYEMDIKQLYKHNILRLLVLYVVWSCVYGLWDARNFQYAEAGWKPYVREMLYGRYHLWFLPMLIGIYVLLPLLRSWIHNSDKKNLQYFMGLFLVFQIGKETLRALTVMDELHYILDEIKIPMVCSYVGYFVWGYYLSHIGISRKIRNIVYVAVIPAMAGNVLLGNYLSHRSGEAQGVFYDSFGIFTFVVVTALFLLAQEWFGLKSFGSISSGIICEISADTLGIYLMHIGLMEALEIKGIHSMLLPNVVGIPVHAMLCFGICLIVAAILRRIPIIGKWLC